MLALAGGHVLVWRLFFLSIGVLLVSYIWTRLASRGIEGQLEHLAKHCQVGESFDEEAVIRNASLLPKLLAKVWEDTDLPGHSNQLVINLRPRGSYYWRTTVHCRLRGQYHLGPLVLEVTDPFGIFPVRRNLGERRTLLVYPATIDLPYFWLTSPIESASGRNRRLTTEPNAVVSRVREYTPGDSLSHVHWHSTAHVGKLIVKDFDGDVSRDIWVITDMSKPPLVRDDADAIEEQCVTIAASLIKKYADSGRRIGLVAQGSNACLFPPRVGHQHLSRVMEALALVKATSEVPINQIIDRGTERFWGNSIVVVVTFSASDDLAASLLHLNGRGATIVAILLDAASFGGTVNSRGIIECLMSSSISVYVVRRGDDLSKALDSRGVVPLTRGSLI
jgi:uncharacterized protein (DUF58 family)